MGGRLHHSVAARVIDPLVRRAASDDVYAVGSLLRQHDAQEAAVLSGHSPLQACFESYVSSETWAGLHPQTGAPVCIFGCGPHLVLEDFGVIWMVGTDDLTERRVKRPLARVSVKVVEYFQDAYPIIGNVADMRNEFSIRWLRWLGFKFLKPFYFGDVQLQEFVRCRSAH